MSKQLTFLNLRAEFFVIIIVMKTLYIERSTGESRDGSWIENLDLDGVDRIVVGTGPGSFAGIRSAIAFAQGFKLGKKCEVLGIPSPCALASDDPLAVIGDARRGKYWVALFDGWKLVCDIFLSTKDDLAKRVPRGIKVTTPDAKRIEDDLKELFGDNYIGGKTPTAEGLERFALKNPAILKPEPLPIYLNPAVRED